MAHVIELDSRRGPQLEDGYTRIANELFEVVIASGFTGRELKVVLAVIRRTYGFRRLRAPLSINDLGSICHLDRSAAAKVVNDLVSRRILFRFTEGQHAHEAAVIGLNKYYQDWLTQAKCGQNDHSSWSENNQNSPENCGQSDHSKCGQSDYTSVVKTTTPYKEERKLKEKSKKNKTPLPPGANANGDATLASSPRAAKALATVPPDGTREVAQQWPPLTAAEPFTSCALTPPEASEAVAEPSQRAAQDPADKTPRCGAGAEADFFRAPLADASAEPAPAPVPVAEAAPARKSAAPRPILTGADAARFERFYAAYPKKRSRLQAMRAFAKLQADDAMVDMLIAAVERAKASRDWHRAGGKYVPYPASWLNAQGWLDELPAEAYTEAQLEVIENYNSILGAAGWPNAVTAPYSDTRATAIDDFLGYSDKPGMPFRYFTHCLHTLREEEGIGFDALIRKSTYLKIREGVAFAPRRNFGGPR